MCLSNIRQIHLQVKTISHACHNYRAGLAYLENCASEVWGQIYDIYDILTITKTIWRWPILER